MKVDVVHTEDCPNWEEAGRRLRTALTDLACRVYYTDGRISGLPSVEQLVQALQNHR
jgi:hypothetical protein